MADYPAGSRNPLVGKIDLRNDAQLVVAEQIHNLYLSESESYTPLGPFDSVPPPPTNFIARPELELFVDRLLDQTQSAATALQGMPGIGKTTMAIALCHDERVRRTFPDGIIWLTFGRQTVFSFDHKVKDVCDALNKRYRTYNETTYRSLLATTAALVVLDDIWDLAVAEKLIPPPGRCRLLYTSRNRDIAAALGAKNNPEIEVLNSEQSRRCLLRWCGKEHVPPPVHLVEGILAECMGLPLALAMIGCRLYCQDDLQWRSVLGHLRKARLKQVGIRPANYQYETLHASIDVSVKALETAEREAYGRLAVLPEDMPADLSILRSLWGVSDDDARERVHILVSRSLATYADVKGSIKLHDLQLDYLCAEHPNQAVLTLQRAALLRSADVLSQDSRQFSSQMCGRLLHLASRPEIASFLRTLEVGTPRPFIRPIWPTLDLADGYSKRVWSDQGNVSKVSISESGHRAASASDACGDLGWQIHAIAAWDLNRSTLLKQYCLSELDSGSETLGFSLNFVYDIAMSGDGNTIVATTSEGFLVWRLDVTSPPILLEGSYHERPIAIDFHGEYVITTANIEDESESEVLALWNLAELKVIKWISCTQGIPKAVAFSAEAQRAIICFDQPEITVWNLDESIPNRTLTGHHGTVNSVAISADGRFGVSGGDDLCVILWHLDSSKIVRRFSRHSDKINSVAISKIGDRILSGGDDHSLLLWGSAREEPIARLKGHDRAVTAVSLSADGKTAFSGSIDKTTRLWDLSQLDPYRMPSHNKPVLTVAISRDAQRVVSGSADHSLMVWNQNDPAAPVRLVEHAGPVSSIALTSDGKRGISGSHDATLMMWDFDRGVCVDYLQEHVDRIRTVALSGCGSVAISGSDERLIVWDLDSKLCRRSFNAGRGAFVASAISLDGRQMAFSQTRLDDGNIRRTVLSLWDLEDDRLLNEALLDYENILSLAISKDGKQVLCGTSKISPYDSFDGQVLIWNVEDIDGPRAMARSIQDHPVYCVSLADGEHRRLAISTHLNDLRIWNVDLERELTKFRGDATWYACASSLNTIAAGDSIGRVHMFYFVEE